MSVSLIKATRDEELKVISSCAEKIWNEYYISILSKEQIDYMIDKFQSVEHMKLQISKEGYEYYKIADGEALCGYMGIKNEGDRLFLSKLYILKECRKKGISSIVLSFLKEYLRKNSLKNIYLTVNKNNLNSIEVYKHFGFKIIKEEKCISLAFVCDERICDGYYFASSVKMFNRFLKKPELLEENVEKVELLPYHLLGISKYETMGIKYRLEGVPAMDKEKNACPKAYTQVLLSLSAFQSTLKI